MVGKGGGEDKKNHPLPLSLFQRCLLLPRTAWDFAKGGWGEDGEEGFIFAHVRIFLWPR